MTKEYGMVKRSQPRSKEINKIRYKGGMIDLTRAQEQELRKAARQGERYGKNFRDHVSRHKKKYGFGAGLAAVLLGKRLVRVKMFPKKTIAEQEKNNAVVEMLRRHFSKMFRKQKKSD